MSDRLERVSSLRAVVVRWQLTGVFVGFVLALGAAMLDAGRNGPLSLHGSVLPRAGLGLLGGLQSLSVPGVVVPALRRPLVAMHVAS